MQTLAELSLHLLERFAPADLFGEHIVKLIRRFLANLQNMTLEFGGLSGKLGRAVVLRERHGDEHVRTFFRAHELRLKAGDEHTAAEGQHLLLGRASLKLFAVHEACVIEHDLVSELGRPIGDRNGARGLLLEPYQLPLELVICHGQLFKICAQALIYKAHFSYLRNSF